MEFINFLNQIDTILYGRKTMIFGGNLPKKKEDTENEKEIWEVVHSKQKYVFSRKQKGTDNKAIFINDQILEEVNKLKNKPGRDIWLYGGANRITSFINLGLVDEFRLTVHPVILGEGKPLFIDIQERLNLKLVNTRSFSSGVVQLIYHLNRD